MVENRKEDDGKFDTWLLNEMEKAETKTPRVVMDLSSDWKKEREGIEVEEDLSDGSSLSCLPACRPAVSV